MPFELTFDRIVAVVGIVLAIILLVLDKAGKLRGPILFVLLGIAALTTIPLALGNSWVKDTPWGLLKFSKGMFMVSSVAICYSLLAIWISSPAETEGHPVTVQPSPPPSPSTTPAQPVPSAPKPVALPTPRESHVTEKPAKESKPDLGMVLVYPESPAFNFQK
jgi:hypothetical protein